MLKDFTIGKYIHKVSIIHRLDPRLKLFFCIIYSSCVFFIKNIFSYLLLIAFFVILIFTSKIKLNVYLKNTKLFLPTLIINLIFRLISIDSNEIFYKFYGIPLPINTLIDCIVVSFKMLLLVLISSLTSFTTTPTSLTKSIKWMLKPLKIFKLPVNDLALIITLSLRLIPMVIEQVNKVIDAQKVRGADFYSRNLINRVKSLVLVIIPTLINLLNKTKSLVIAMECRCYTGKDRTEYEPLVFKKKDIFASIFLSVFILALIKIDNQ